MKDKYFNRETITDFAEEVKRVYTDFDSVEFVDKVIGYGFFNLELKARMRKVSTTLGKFLPKDYEEAIDLLNKVKDNYKKDGFLGMVFPDFVEVYGIDYFDISIKALEKYTKGASSEFAVRPFIIKYEERMMKQMYDWSNNKDEEVRRLASEGLRPSLPWAEALVEFKKDPTPILPILENLKKDESTYVRKSVANNLNDISKTHPNIVIKIAKEWYGENDNTDWIVKHACRTLLKQGIPEVLEIFGFQDSDISISDFTIFKNKIRLGESIDFSFSISSTKEAKVRLEYFIDFMRANGKQRRKIFQISEVVLKANETREYTKKYDFISLSTRNHYVGEHSIAVIVNGITQEKLDFEVTS